MVRWREFEIFPAITRVSALVHRVDNMPVNLLMIRVVINVEVGNQSEFHVRCSNLLLQNLISSLRILVVVSTATIFYFSSLNVTASLP